MSKLLTVLCLFLAASAVQAIPVYLRLTGQVDRIQSSQGVDVGVVVGDTIEQVWMYDLDVQGFNETVVFDSFDHSTETGRFFVDRIGEGTIESFYDLDIVSQVGCIGVCDIGMGFSLSTTLPGNGPWMRNLVTFNDGIPEMFHIDMEFYMVETGRLFGINRNERTVFSSGVITAISTVNPISEPSTAWLLLPGLLGLAFTYKS